MTWVTLVEEVSARCFPTCFEKKDHERWKMTALPSSLWRTYMHSGCIHACTLHLCLDIYLSHQRTATALTAGASLSPRWVMAYSPAWCQSPYLRASEWERRDGQSHRGWMAVWKDGVEQPVVKDRHSLTGADADTSAMALHHLPFTGHANHALWREKLPALLLALPLWLC